MMSVHHGSFAGSSVLTCLSPSTYRSTSPPRRRRWCRAGSRRRSCERNVSAGGAEVGYRRRQPGSSGKSGSACAWGVLEMHAVCTAISTRLVMRAARMQSSFFQPPPRRRRLSRARRHGVGLAGSTLRRAGRVPRGGQAASLQERRALPVPLCSQLPGWAVEIWNHDAGASRSDARQGKAIVVRALRLVTVVGAPLHVVCVACFGVPRSCRAGPLAINLQCSSGAGTRSSSDFAELGMVVHAGRCT